MTKVSIEYTTPTPAAIRRGLRQIGYSQSRAARETGQSPSLVSMVLRRRAKSAPCLIRLQALILSHSEASHAHPDPNRPEAAHEGDGPRQSRDERITFRVTEAEREELVAAAGGYGELSRYVRDCAFMGHTMRLAQSRLKVTAV